MLEKVTFSYKSQFLDIKNIIEIKNLNKSKKIMFGNSKRYGKQERNNKVKGLVQVIQCRIV